ncbi:hypothetical protein [Pseudonocardia sp. ICBG1142]|uniref:sunset domain-containing protein n=1 Tax=Pseudonocardia sp. ICBG1142 TaxID=2846760 RepID=UPI001CF6CEE9|nr:hypothetical protein [Pseudonocardia sp. ICBG1142]
MGWMWVLLAVLVVLVAAGVLVSRRRAGAVEDGPEATGAPGTVEASDGPGPGSGPGTVGLFEPVGEADPARVTGATTPPPDSAPPPSAVADGAGEQVVPPAARPGVAADVPAGSEAPGPSPAAASGTAATGGTAAVGGTGPTGADGPVGLTGADGPATDEPVAVAQDAPAHGDLAEGHLAESAPAEEAPAEDGPADGSAAHDAPAQVAAARDEPAEGGLTEDASAEKAPADGDAAQDVAAAPAAPVVGEPGGSAGAPDGATAPAVPLPRPESNPAPQDAAAEDDDEPSGRHALRDDVEPAPLPEPAPASDDGGPPAPLPIPSRTRQPAGGSALAALDSLIIGPSAASEPLPPGVRPGPYPDSVLAPADGGDPPETHRVKVHSGSRRFHPPESPYYVRTRADLYFTAEGAARAAGFIAWNERPGAR